MLVRIVLPCSAAPADTVHAGSNVQALPEDRLLVSPVPLRCRLHLTFVVSESTRATDMQNVPEEWRERGSRDGGQAMGSKSWEGEPLPQRDGSRGPPGEQDAALTRARRRDQGASGGEDRGETRGKGPEESDRESLMMELSRLVQKTVKESSWWERRGIDCSILAAGFLCLPPGE